MSPASTLRRRREPAHLVTPLNLGPRLSSHPQDSDSDRRQPGRETSCTPPASDRVPMASRRTLDHIIHISPPGSLRNTIASFEKLGFTLSIASLYPTAIVSLPCLPCLSCLPCLPWIGPCYHCGMEMETNSGLPTLDMVLCSHMHALLGDAHFIPPPLLPFWRLLHANRYICNPA